MDLERQVDELTQRVAALEAAVMNTDALVAMPVEAAQTPGPAFLPATASPILATTPPPPAMQPATAAVPVQTMQQHPPPPPGYAPSPNQPPPPPPSSSPTAYAEAARRSPAAFEWGIETTLRWAGVVLVTLAGIFLVSTAISRGWIGPELQLLGAALGGAGLLAGAVRLAASRRPWALTLGCGGAVVLAASAIATHEWLDLVGPGPAVVMLAIASAASIAVALHLRLEGIAVVAGVLGMYAPLETLNNFGGGAPLTWVTGCIVATSALGLAKNWPGLRIITAWLGATILAAYAIIEDVEGSLQAMGFAGTIFVGATLWAGPSLARRLGPADGPGMWGTFNWRSIDYRLVALVPAWTWVVVGGMLWPAENDTVGLIAIVIALAFLGLAVATWKQIERLVSMSTILGSLGLLAVGLAIFLDGPALMIALAGQAITSYYLSRHLDDTLLRISGYVAFGISSILAIYEMLYALDNDGFANVGAGLASLAIVLCWVGAAALSYDRDDLEIPFELPFIGAWVGTMIWLGSALVDVPQGLVLISVAWTIMACVGLVLGLTGRISVVKNIALGTLGVTLFKLVTVDMAEVDVFWRVGLFFVVGMGLIALGLKVPSLIRPSATPPEDQPINPLTGPPIAGPPTSPPTGPPPGSPPAAPNDVATF